MKKLLLFFILVLNSFILMAQVKAPKGIIVKAGDTLTVNELSTLNGINTDKTIATQLGETVKTAEVQKPATIQTDNIYATVKMTAPTMPPGTSTTDVANTIFVDEMTFSHNRYLAWLKANGQSKLLGVPMFASNLLASQRSGVDGNMYLSSIQMNKDTVITTLTAQMVTAGVYTGDNYNGMVVYRTSASGITLAAKTTNDENCWTGAAGTLITKTLESPVSVTKGEIIMVGFHYNNSAQTTAPIIATYGTSGTYLYAFLTNNRKLTGVIATSTPGASYTWSSVYQNGDIIGILPK